MSATLIAVTATAQILGNPCAHASSMECGTLAGHNNGLPFLFLCGPDHTITSYDDCTCEGCCILEGQKGASAKNKARREFEDASLFAHIVNRGSANVKVETVTVLASFDKGCLQDLFTFTVHTFSSSPVVLSRSIRPVIFSGTVAFLSTTLSAVLPHGISL
ncbi:uncharacterized protein EDB91DRAFT_1085418 [Suillus paluster]|uniref:uncharacterized protein n=1 Tax=Suillus paluster TaxID=48578 RepID=UPI001B86D1DD|nr:uncharacterized protein EDB91DRAFT_1085418 [Suillus paluster]KAG1730547.1 hypothetical protein EDB91DRAFT_1085418 [Suillus paluster]